MKHIVKISGGLASAEALRRTVEKYGKESVIALFCDVKGDASVSHASWSDMPFIDHMLHMRYGGETLDTYRFLWELSYALDVPILRLEHPQKLTTWAVWVKTKSFRLWSGNAFYCKASDMLKRETAYEHLKDLPRGSYSIVLGMGVFEQHRVVNAQKYWTKKLGWDVPIVAPLTEKPYLENINIRDNLLALGIETIPSAYEEDFEHNNCSAICVQGGQEHYATLYKKRPEHYMYAAWMEKRVGKIIGGYTILKDERGGETKRLSLYDFIPRIEAGDYRKSDGSGCGCFANLPMELVQACEVKPRQKTKKEKVEIKNQPMSMIQTRLVGL